MDLIILYWLLLTSLLSSSANKSFCQLFKHFLRAEIKLVAESYPNLPFSLFKDRHWLSLHEPFKTLPVHHKLSSTTVVSNISSLSSLISSLGNS